MTSPTRTDQRRALALVGIVFGFAWLGFFVYGLGALALGWSL